MANVLILYATTHGQTGLIAERMAATAHAHGHRATLVSIEEPHTEPSPMHFDAVMIGGSVHASKFSQKLLVYIRRHRRELAEMPTAFFSVCLGIASVREEDHATARACVQTFLQSAEWKPGMVSIFPGALKYTRYGLFIRWIMKSIARREGLATDTSRDHVYTDWEDVVRFTEHFLAPFDPMLHVHEPLDDAGLEPPREPQPEMQPEPQPASGEEARP